MAWGTVQISGSGYRQSSPGSGGFGGRIERASRAVTLPTET
ncbi:hypothetical protein [Mycolicibacterium agri]|nr:hypothetical protein [Mycolicibacterium agri]